MGRRILVVEDEPFVREVIAEILTDEGFSVTQAACGDEAAGLIDDLAAELRGIRGMGRRHGNTFRESGRRVH